MTLSVNYSMTADDSRTPTAQGVLLGTLSILEHQRKTWAPNLLAGVLWRALTNLCALREVLRLLKLPLFAETAHNNPRFPFKYLTHHYLSRNFTVTERASCFLHHHRRMYAALPDRLLRQTLQGDVTLHEIHQEGNRIALTPGLPRPLSDSDKEGELSLDLKVDGKKIFKQR